MMWTAPGPESVREAEEVGLVDGVQHLDRGALEQLVFQRAVTASGRCRPSALGMYTLRTGFARYAPRLTLSARSRKFSSSRPP